MLRRKPGILCSWEWRRSSSTSSLPYCSKQFLTIILLVLCSILDSHRSVVQAKTSESRVVCYYTNWSAYRQGPAKFLPDNINPYLCTHLIYAFGGLTSDSGIKPFDKYQDIDKGNVSKPNLSLQQFLTQPNTTLFDFRYIGIFDNSQVVTQNSMVSKPITKV